jgi:hypothetical protein
VHFKVPPEYPKAMHELPLKSNLSHSSSILLAALSPHVGSGAPSHPDVFIWQLEHFNAPFMKPSEYVEHNPSPNPKLPSQLSPVSIFPFPHFGFSTHSDVSNWHFEVHFKVPPEN